MRNVSSTKSPPHCRADRAIDADTDSLLAIRSGQWRVFDFIWGLHIMNLHTREDTSHPLLIGLAALASLGVVVGLVLLPRRRRRGCGSA